MAGIKRKGGTTEQPESDHQAKKIKTAHIKESNIPLDDETSHVANNVQQPNNGQPLNNVQPLNNGQQPNNIQQPNNVLNYLLSADTDEDNNNEKAPKKSTDEEEKLKSFFSLLTVVICSLFSFAFWYARSQNFSFYGLVALYVVAYNILVCVHYLDERREYWLNDSSKHKNTESDGLLLRVVLIANLSFVVYFVSLETARRLLSGNSSQVSSLLQLWNILRGTVANVATMVIFLSAATFVLLHLVYVFVIVAGNTCRQRLPALGFVALLFCALWYYDSCVGQSLHLGVKLLHVFLAINFVFAFPVDFFRPTIWRASIFVVGGLLVGIKWLRDYSSTEPQLTLLSRFFHVYFWAMFVFYVPPLDFIMCKEEEKKPDDNKTDVDKTGTDNNDEHWIRRIGSAITSDARGLFAILNINNWIFKTAYNVRKMFFELFVEIPLIAIFGNKHTFRKHFLAFCSRDARAEVKKLTCKDTVKKLTCKDTNKQTGAVNGIMDRIKTAVGNACEQIKNKTPGSVGYVIIHILMLLRRDNVDDSFGSFKDVYNFFASDESQKLFMIGFIIVTLLRLRFIAQDCFGLFVNTLAPFLGDFMKSPMAPISVSLCFLIVFSFFFMLGASAIFNGFASVVVADHDDPFVLSLKRVTFYAVTTVCISFIYVAFDLLRDSLTVRLQEEADNMYKFAALVSGVKVQKDGESNDAMIIRKKRRNMQIAIFLSLLVGGFTGMYLHPSNSDPFSSYSRANDTISLFNMTLSRDNQHHDQLRYIKSFNHSYSACSARWGGDLTALDHAILARMAYFQPDACFNEKKKCDDVKTKKHAKELADMKDALTFFFPEKHYGKVSLIEDWQTHSLRKADIVEGRFHKFYRFDFPKQKHTVISVQGTDPGDMRDVIVDLRLWVVSALADITEKFMFLMNLIPKRNRAKLQGLIDLIQTTFVIDESKLDFYVPVVRYVHELITKDEIKHRKYTTGQDACGGDECWTISLAGHSLGGGIASIVGSTLGISSVSFSGPGFVNAKSQFGTAINNDTEIFPNLARAISLNTVFIPSNDAVPRFDSHIGAIHHTACTTTGPLSCHSISAMVCDLLMRCGDNHNGERINRCDDSCFKPTLDVFTLENNIQ